MIRFREQEHKCLTRHAVATVLVCADLPALPVVTKTMVMIVAKGKEAAP